MMEIPESDVFARQLSEHAVGRVIRRVQANHTPHRLVWYFGDPQAYPTLLTGRRVTAARRCGGNVELFADGACILYQDGAAPRLLSPGDALPKRHQLLLEFEDGGALVCTVQMYGGLCAYREGENDNLYYLAARDAVSPLSDAFDEAYFQRLCGCEGFEKLSAKAFLATQQRIPGLGNGVLQDILFNARLHPKKRMGETDSAQRGTLYRSVKETLEAMARQGGRDTMRDLFGQPGGYRTILSQKTAGGACPRCGETIQKGSYLGGSIYFCPQCQCL